MRTCLVRVWGNFNKKNYKHTHHEHSEQFEVVVKLKEKNINKDLEL